MYWTGVSLQLTMTLDWDWTTHNLHHDESDSNTAQPHSSAGGRAVTPAMMAHSGGEKAGCSMACGGHASRTRL